ncbi:siroheme synthase [Quercus suber]|uniref:uroporphyrinogen-III C-methyltransferase n=2 Tax=Quercus suber TaxID=58331 RepID=A0AAW0LE04_QUESU
MALCTRLQSFPSSSLSSNHIRPTKALNFHPICSLHYNSHSPFTEKHSIERYHRDQWLYKTQLENIENIASCSSPPPDSNSVRQNEIALQLPELKKLLQVLREKREREGCGGWKKCGPGNVFLVGTGPGDPELLTLKAVRVIQSADLLLYDRLVSNDVLDLVGPNARLLYVGKTAGYHSRTQEEIHELLLSFAEAGATVVRLKGGDPLVFGRGGEEMDFLQQQGIHVKVIPGITAASGIAAELGIPLTHRGVANSVRFLTGHSRKGGTDPLFVAENAADPDSTLVIYMGLSTFPSLALKLMHHGLPPNTPAVAVERGTTPQQRMVFAELKDLANKITTVELVSPTLMIIGNVVALSPLWSLSMNEASCMEEIHELLLSFAEAGATVVRLKGGDPLVFGRGGEEMDFLQQQGIHVKVIPGITAASGIAAELGIPLTHRGVANSVRFLTGHSRKGGTDPLFVAENAADPDSTLVIYMGLSTFPSLAQKLMHHGLPPNTPAVAVERGTTPQQRMVFAELKDLANKITTVELVSPTLMIIGNVVALSPLWSLSMNEASCLVQAK